MEQPSSFSKQDAKAVLIKHQRKVTSHRVDVLFFLMSHKKAYSLKQLANHFKDAIDRATVYRVLSSFAECGFVIKALNHKGHTCFFYKEHLGHDHNNQAFLECLNCEEVIALPAYSDQYINTLNTHKAVPLSTLIQGLCNRGDCK